MQNLKGFSPKGLTFQNLILGFLLKKALTIPSLPPKFSIFYSHIFIRIFRFLGDVALFITVFQGYGRIPIQDYSDEFFCNLLTTVTFITRHFLWYLY
jgi:hypothetical protein